MYCSGVVSGCNMQSFVRCADDNGSIRYDRIEFGAGFCPSICREKTDEKIFFAVFLTNKCVR